MSAEPRIVTARGVPLSKWVLEVADRPTVAAAEAVPLPVGATVLVFAAHPDDETLGVGGLIANLTGRGINVQVACLTDGSAAFAGVGFDLPELASIRRLELDNAMAHLGAKVIASERLPDGELSRRTAHLDAVVEEVIIVSQPDLVLCPWSEDPHPDHAALGASVLQVLDNAKMPSPLMYPVWMTHGYAPTDQRVDLDRILLVQTSDEDKSAKLVAIMEYISQVRPVSPELEAVLPQHVLERFTDLPEMLIPSSGGLAEERTSQKPVDEVSAYFDAKMADGLDSWNDESSWYERRKRSVVLASLRAERYPVVWEPACGGGQLTADLALRCDSLFASDGSAKAVTAARERCAELANVSIDRVVLPAPPPVAAGSVDLTVLSEFLYYLHSSERRAVLQQVVLSSAPIADVVIAHWRHRAEDTHESGDAVVEEAEDFLTSNGFETIAMHDDEEFLVIVLHRG